MKTEMTDELTPLSPKEMSDILEVSFPNGITSEVAPGIVEAIKLTRDQQLLNDQAQLAKVKQHYELKIAFALEDGFHKGVGHERKYGWKAKLDRPKVICLCGSTRFIRQFQEYYAKLTDEGCIVLTVGRVVPQHEQHLERKKKLDELHLRKIDLADEVFVINVNGYIGESTSREIDCAMKLGKPIKYLEAIDEG